MRAMTPPAISSRIARVAPLVFALSLAAGAGGGARAQQADSARIGISPQTDSAAVGAPAVMRSAADSLMDHRDSVLLKGPPIRPKTALLRSLIVPGWGQASLDRGTAGATYFALEAGSIAMLHLREERAQGRQACRARQHLCERLHSWPSAQRRRPRAHAPAPGGGLGCTHLLHPSLLRRRRLRLGASLGRARAGARWSGDAQRRSHRDDPLVSGNGAPIGVFDSGIGGLTVVRELERQLPHERIIYFGDTARVPYGPKSPETVRATPRDHGLARRARG